MNLSIYQQNILSKYKSNSQRIRVLTETWFLKEMYCPCCLNLKINDFPNNKKGSDFFCPDCANEFQLKSSKKKFGKKVVDGEYNTMKKIILSKKSPNFFLLRYSNSDWFIKDLVLIPKFFINFSILEKRKPLSQNAKRSGWVGCNFILRRLPEEGKINIIRNEKVIEKRIINKTWKKMFFMNRQKSGFRGWTSDILKIVEELPSEFSLKDIYDYEEYLKNIHPSNQHIKAKIRQQLQVLRDNKIIQFTSQGNYKKI